MFLDKVYYVSAVCAGLSGANCIKGILDRFLNIVVWPIFFTLSVIMFIWAGVLFLTAKGDPTRVVLAQKAVLWGVIGIVVAIVGFSAERIVSGILGA